MALTAHLLPSAGACRMGAVQQYLLAAWRSAANPPHAAAAAIDRLLLLFLFILLAHQQKAAGRKTRLDIQNYGCNGNLLCYHGVVERNRISSLQSHGKAWKGIGKGMLSPWYLL